jgi:hypothetical protein
MPVLIAPPGRLECIPRGGRADNQLTPGRLAGFPAARGSRPALCQCDHRGLVVGPVVRDVSNSRH